MELIDGWHLLARLQCTINEQLRALDNCGQSTWNGASRSLQRRTNFVSRRCLMALHLFLFVFFFSAVRLLHLYGWWGGWNNPRHLFGERAGDGGVRLLFTGPGLLAHPLDIGVGLLTFNGKAMKKKNLRWFQGQRRSSAFFLAFKINSTAAH